ncbi:hypothetical protein [Bacillus sp. FJAT-47783]|uniref:hypothetical protein n=1 Tax=Bacillus sp. FJAT-47783 TaxID=2922712 RepID=UPI001FADCBA1|nr:hypothetical protein [Bacillus sp. FJAT-47783]
MHGGKLKLGKLEFFILNVIKRGFPQESPSSPASYERNPQVKKKSLNSQARNREESESVSKAEIHASCERNPQIMKKPATHILGTGERTRK